MRCRDVRLDLHNRVELVWRGSKTRADIENISLGGALISANLPAKIGDAMAIHLEDEAFPVSLDMNGEVIRRGVIRRGMPTFAVKFGEPPETLQVFIHYLMVTHRTTAV